jgi:hypothetical protein
VLLAMLRDGRIHMSGMALLVPVLTQENRDAVLERATHQSKRQIEQLVAELAPKPDAPSVMRKLPVPSPGAANGGDQGFGRTFELVPGTVAASRAPELVPGTAGSSASAASRRAVVEPLSPGRSPQPLRRRA